MQLTHGDFPYITVGAPKDPSSQEDFDDTKLHSLNPYLLETVVKLHAKKPAWVFKTSYNKRRDIPLGEGGYEREYRGVSIWENSMVIGSVRVEIEYSGRARERCPVFYIQASRIRKQRGTANTKSTTKQSVVVETCIKYMYAPTVLEMGNKAATETRTVVTDAVNHARSNLYNGINSRDLRVALLSFAVKNREAFNVAFPLHDADLLEAMDFQQDFTICSQVLGAPLLVSAVLNHQQVHVFNPDGTLLALDDDAGSGLPEWFRRKLGLLKLVDPKQFVRDVGVRVSDNSYGVMMDVANNETIGETK
jgi:hypothetical protein